MAFQNSGFNQQNNQIGDKPKTNFPVGTIKAADGKLDIIMWKAESKTLAIFQVKQAIGKDPTSGANVYENKGPNEIPRVFMDATILRALNGSIEQADPNNININVPQNPGNPNNTNHLIITGNANQIKITLESVKNGNRTITFDAIPTGTTNINANWDVFKEYIKIAYKKSLTARLDPNEFGAVIAGDDNQEEAPI